MNGETTTTDYCEVPLAQIRDEGPLVAAAGFLTAGCTAEEAGACGPHAVLPILYCIRFSIELSLHGCVQALEEGRSCSGRTERVTHDLDALFREWKKQMGDSSRRLGWYGSQHPDLDALWPTIEPFHLLDPDGTCLRYPKNFPDYPDACALLGSATAAVSSLVDHTHPLVPSTRTDCRKRLAFLRAVALDPCCCIGPIDEFDERGHLGRVNANSEWPAEWGLTPV